MGLGVFCAPAASAITEYQLKSTYIVNFLKFVQWPGGKDVSSLSHINVCYTGRVPNEEIGDFLGNVKNSAYKISLREQADFNEGVDDCHILFFGPNAKISSDDLASARHQVLTVGEGEAFISQGGMISFVNVDSKIKFIINRKPISKAGLRIDARLLEAALKVLDQ